MSEFLQLQSQSKFEEVGGVKKYYKRKKMKTCMNILCGTTSSAEWKSGWRLRSGDLAVLCDKCGYAFEQRVYCEEFHADDSGWRNCVSCSKRLHCGCIASLSLIELLDGGGVKCTCCTKIPDINTSLNGGKSAGFGPCIVSENNAGIGAYKERNGISQLPVPHHSSSYGTLGVLKQDGFLLPPAEAGTTWASNFPQHSMGFLQKARLDISSNNMQSRESYQPLVHQNLNISLAVSAGNLQPTSGAVVEEREQSKMSNSAHQGFVSPSLLPTPPRMTFSRATDTNVSLMPPMRVARPPVDGRGRHQLLPRYWPRITDQELQQLSGDPNCTIVPLFEKMLSASDAGRIGRLVLPKACAEAYFPPISQPEGLPIKIQDVKGKEWVFQFRFWPNNNSRMYVLEGVTPCIQSMQLQAGDTVTFSRMDPEGKLVMGFRKASNSASMQSMKGSVDNHMNGPSSQLDSVAGDIRLYNNEKCDERTEEGMLPTSLQMMERKKSRNIGSKSKRLLIDTQDVQALRLTWEEVQGMLRPPQSAVPSIVKIEDYEFEEYEEPPVFGKSSIFTARPSGLIEQWTQCDNCLKWRRLPGDILLPPKWTCADNAWDPTRCFCSAPDEFGPRELESLLALSKDSRKKRMAMAYKAMQEQESSALDALASAAAQGDNSNEPGTSSVAATTKHPRHRPGCSCIVCIQPPSGKGKHKSTCTCTVCMTVKRRFKTLMMRKKKRQSDQEAEMALKHHEKQNGNSEDDKALVENNISYLEHRHEGEDDRWPAPESARSNGGQTQNQNQTGVLTDCSVALDLNFHPERDVGLRVAPAQASFCQLVGIPLEVSTNGLTKLTSEQQDVSAVHTHPEQGAGEAEGRLDGDHPVDQVLHERANQSDGNCEPDNNKQQSDPL